MAELLINGVIALIIASGLLNGFKGKEGMFLLGLFIFHPCWAIGAIRLGKPGSTWACYSYDASQLNESWRRFPKVEPGWLVTRPARRPDELTAGCGMYALAGLVMVASGLPASIIAGVLAPTLAMTWRGWSPGRAMLGVLGVLAAGGTLGLGFVFPDDGTTNYIRPGGLLGAPVAAAVLCVLTVAGLMLLYWSTTRSYFRAVITRPPGVEAVAP